MTRWVYTYNHEGVVVYTQAIRTWRRGYLYIPGLGITPRWWTTHAAALEAARAYTLAQFESWYVRWLIADMRINTQEINK